MAFVASYEEADGSVTPYVTVNGGTINMKNYRRGGD